MSLVETIKRDPAGAGMAIIIPAFIVIAAAAYLHDTQPGVENELERSIPRTSQPHVRTYGPAEAPPAKWLEEAEDKDVMVVPGYKIAYWGRPNPDLYGPTDDAKPFQGIIVHYNIPAFGMTDQEWTVRLVKFQHNGDLSRRGNHFGYHFYIDGQGGIYQGAPMTFRTNHVLPGGHRQRKPLARHLNNTNAIGISMVGACVSVGHGIETRCIKEEITPEQKAAGKALIAALKKRYKLKCLVYGHGEVQANKANFEGAVMSQYIREGCDAQKS